jgi:tetratricopeptide (TPR) repeat protein
MKRILTTFALVTLTIVGLFFANQALLLAKPSVTAPETMLTGNQLYESGQYAQAGQAYQQLVHQGYADSVLFYNLGNAYFKQGDYGRAILNYRRAEDLAPRDPDIQANLALAQAQTVDQLEGSLKETGFFANVAGLMGSWFTLNEQALITLGLWVLFAFLLIGFGSSRRGSGLREGLGYALVVVSLLLAVGLVGLASRLHTEKARTEAVIVAQEVSVTSGPGSQQYVTEFALHSGTEVSLVETRENWVRLSAADGEVHGWVPASAVETVAMSR